MASRTPAGGAGAPSASAEPHIDDTEQELYKRIWSNPLRRVIIFNIMTCIHNAIYTEKLLKIPNIHNFFTYYMKGGNAVALLEFSGIDPYVIDFPSDFDFSLLINPYLDIDQYNRIQKTNIEQCLNILQQVCHIKEIWSPFIELLPTDYKDKKDRKSGEIIPNHIIISGMPGTIGVPNANGRYLAVNIGKISHPNPYLNELFHSLKGKILPNECPFKIIITPNILHNNKLLNIGVIKLCLRDDKRTELYNMSFVLRHAPDDTLLNYEKNTISSNISNSKIVRDWNLTRLLYHTNRFTSYIYDPLTAYINMRIAAKGNTRPNKIKRRTNRAIRLKNKILNPNWRIYSLKKTHRNALPNNLKPILNNIHNVHKSELPSLPGK